MTDTTDTTPDIADLQAKLAEAVNGIDALKAKNEELLGEKKAAQKKAQEEADARQKAADEAAAKSGDVDALNKSWEAKLAKREAELAEAVKERDGKLFDLTVNAEARRIASELALPGSADVLLPHIKARLKYENGQVAVLDAEGKLSASTLDDLAKEIASDTRFAPVIVGSRASGGGANGSHTRGGAVAFQKGNAAGTRDEARARAEQLLNKFAKEE